MDSNIKPVIAVDLGGTKIVAALVSRQGLVVDVKKTDTLAGEGFQPVANRLFSSIDTLLRSNSLSPGDLSGISVAVASPIDMANGLVTTPPNLPGWRLVPLRDIIREKYGISSYLINDAKAAAVAEFLLGSGKGIDNMLAVTLGTGIGCGIIIGGRLYWGESGAAGEVGHMTIDANGPTMRLWQHRLLGGFRLGRCHGEGGCKTPQCRHAVIASRRQSHWARNSSCRQVGG